MSSPITKVLLTYINLNFFMEKSEKINDKFKTAIPKILIHMCTLQNLEEQFLRNHYVISVDRYYYLGKVDDLQYSDETTL